MEVKRAIIPAAGQGIRMRPFSQKVPKELFPLGKKLVLDYALEESVWSGIEEICIVISPQKESIRERYTKQSRGVVETLGQILNFVDIRFVTQQQPQGLGDAIWVARDFTCGQDFAVLLPDNVFRADVPPLAQLKRQHEEFRACCVGVMAVPENKAVFFTSTRKLLYHQLPQGVYKQGVYKIERILDDDPGPVRTGELRSIGRYILSTKFFDYYPAARRRVRGEIRETDVLKEYLLDENELYGLRIEAERFDSGSMEGYAHAFMTFIDHRW